VKKEERKRGGGEAYTGERKLGKGERIANTEDLFHRIDLEGGGGFLAFLCQVFGKEGGRIGRSNGDDSDSKKGEFGGGVLRKWGREAVKY